MRGEILQKSVGDTLQQQVAVAFASSIFCLVNNCSAVEPYKILRMLVSVTLMRRGETVDTVGDHPRWMDGMV